MMSRKSIFTAILWILVSLAAAAQDVIVTVTPVQQVLPPQVLMYIDNPGKFFTVSLTNTTDQEQLIYMGMQIEQINPAAGLSVSTPPKRQPSTPLRLPAKGVVNLTSIEIKNLFKHIPSNEISCPEGLFDDYQNGSFALLPEGQYQVHLTAYRWSNPQYATPLVVSNPTGGMGLFTVCYKAQAPEFLLPNPMLAQEGISLVDPLMTMFRWSEPTLVCNPAAQSYRYDLRIVELLPGQQPDDAMDHNPVLYLSRSNSSPLVFVPALNMQRDFKTGKTYLAQVTAKPVTSSVLNYVMIENSGKSTYCKFQVKSVDDIFSTTVTGGSGGSGGSGGKDKKEGEKEEGEDEGDDEGEGDKDGKGGSGGSGGTGGVEFGGISGGELNFGDLDVDGSGFPNVDVGLDLTGTIDKFTVEGDELDLPDVVDDLFLIFGETRGNAEITETAPYRFRNPKIDKPVFINESIHRFYESNDINLEWTRAWYLGGEGANPEQIEFKYNVQLFNGGDVVGFEEAFQTVPIYEETTDKEEFSIKWDKFKDKVKVGDEIYVRILPIPSMKADEIEWEGKDNQLGLTLCRPVSQDLFQCTPTVEITNLHPTTLGASDLKGKRVKMGEFEMQITEISASTEKTGAWKGKGKVLWQPLGFDTWVMVQFDTIRINTDLQVYGGEARTYSGDSKISQNAQGVKTLFSDWGLDNLTGGSAGYQYSETTVLDEEDPNNAISVNVDVQGYYAAFHNMGGDALKVANKLGQVKLDEFYCPARLPDWLGLTALDMQIHSMTFAPTYAMMDIVGELAIGEGKKPSVLMFGAPRLCISPDELLPETGHIALLADYNGIRDAKTGYSCHFKAPKNLKEPSDGCYLAWKANKFGRLGIDVDMKIPNLLKVVDGKATQKKPILNIKTTIDSWDDWVAEASIDPFEVEHLPGWTFTAKDLIIDHSRNLNGDDMPQFPSGYDKSKAGIEGQNPEYWEGLFIRSVGLQMPKDLSPGANRTELSFNNMFIDASGLTMKGGVSDVVKGKTSELGGWSFHLKEVGISFIQSDFNNCYFNGNVGLPLLTDNDGNKTLLDFNCEIRRRIAAGGTKDGTALLFTVQAADDQDMNLDLFLAKLKLRKATTYIAAESVFGAASAADNHTYVEFCMGGVIELGHKAQIEKFGKSKLDIDINIPDVHFTGFRLANCSDEKWTSAYESISSLQKARRAVKLNPDASLLYYAGEEKHQADFYFNIGSWSLASLQKSLGPLKFTLDTYKLNVNIKAAEKQSYLEVGLDLGGSVSLVDGISLTAAAEVNLKAHVYNFKKIDDIKTEFKGVFLTKCSVDCSVAGMTFMGALTLPSADLKQKFGEGFSAALKFSLPGDLFTFESAGGFYKKTGFNWGYLTLSAKSAVGVAVPPIEFNGFSGGFYFNCSSKASDPNDVTPKKGVIGLMLGVHMQAVGSPDLFKGDLSMTVCYDSKAGRLSQFLFTGNMNAVNGLIDSKVNIVYEHNDLDKYFQLNLTVDVAAIGADALKALNPEMPDFATKADMTKDAKNLENAEKESTAGEDKVDGDPKPTDEGAKEHKKPSISLDFKVTFKENGKTLPRKKWHLYLGEPDLNKRINLELINIKAKIVTLNVGANMYVCVGNELPNDGALPPIPETISKFLDGSTKGAGVQSDNASAANAARSAAAGNFGGSVVGGVMFGAEVYGHLDLDLGIIYGKLDMLAGFDVSLRKLSGSAECMNLGKKPGWHDWYGEGQLYAYLAAALGLHVDLGFIDTKIPLIDAAMGGVLQMGGPAPSYFIGKVRAKVKLLGGLVKFDKKFEFECGKVCRLYRGDPLDDFVLFDKFTVGDTIQDNGWNKKNAIAPSIVQSPRINANSSLNEHFRMLDENELETIKEGYNSTGADDEDLEMQAQRTFIFRHRSSSAAGKATVKLSQYDSSHSNVVQSWDIPVLNERGTFLALDLNALNTHIYANNYYTLEVTGYAKELVKGSEVNPRKYTGKGRYTSKPWEQTAIYYFCTNDNEDIEDQAELQKYVALAYPSKMNQLMDGVPDHDTKNYRETYYNDATAPTIAMNRDIHELAFRKGRVQWRVSTPDNFQISASDAAWVTDNNICSLEPKNVLQGVKESENYILSLDYLVPGQSGGVDTICLSRQHIRVLPKDYTWQTGVTGANSTDYEKPFVVTALDSYPLENTDIPHVSQYEVAMGKSVGDEYIFTLDPVNYISYLTHWLFVGGRKVQSSFYNGLYVTTTQSAILDVPGVGSYEGIYSPGISRPWEKLSNIRQLLFYTGNSRLYGLYALPTLNDPAYDYVGITDPGILPHVPSKDLFATTTRVLNRIEFYYDAVEKTQKELRDAAMQLVQDVDRPWLKISTKSNQRWFLQSHIGTYFGDSILHVPYYQVMIACSPHKEAGQYSISSIFSDNLGERAYTSSQFCAMLNLTGSTAKLDDCLKDNSLHGVEAGTIWPSDFKGYKSYSAIKALKRITKMSFVSYRVNAFDLSSGQYTTHKLLNGRHTFRFYVDNPYDNPKAYEATNMIYNTGVNDKTVSSGTAVGGESFNMATNTQVNANLDYMKGYVRSLLDNNQKLAKQHAESKEVFADMSKRYEQGMKDIVKYYNAQDFSSGTLTEYNLTQGIDQLKNIMYGDHNPASTYYDQTNTIFKQLQASYNAIAKQVSSNSAMLADAQSELDRGIQLKTETVDNFQEITDWYNAAVAMKDDYLKAQAMLNAECYKNAKEIWSNAVSLYTRTNTALKKGGTFDSNNNTISENFEEIKKQLTNERKSYGDEYYVAEYNRKKEFDTKINTIASQTVQLINETHEIIDSVNSYKSEASHLVSDIAAVAPQGTSFYKVTQNEVDKIINLNADRAEALGKFVYTSYDVEDYVKRSAEYMAVLKMRADAEPYMLKLLALQEKCNSLDEQISEYYIGGEQVDQLEELESLVESRLTSCINYVTGNLESGTAGKTLSSSSTIYSDFVKALNSLRDTKHSYSSNLDKLNTTYEELVSLQSQLNENYQAYCGIMTIENELKKAKDVYDESCKLIKQNENSYTYSRNTFDICDEIANRAYQWQSFYPSVTAINNKGKEIISFYDALKGDVDKSETLKTSTLASTDVAEKITENFYNAIKAVNAQHEQIFNGKAGVTDKFDFTRTVNGKEVTKSYNLVEFWYDYVEGCTKETMLLAEQVDVPDEYIELKALYENSYTKRDEHMKTVPSKASCLEAIEKLCDAISSNYLSGIQNVRSLDFVELLYKNNKTILNNDIKNELKNIATTIQSSGSLYDDALAVEPLLKEYTKDSEDIYSFLEYVSYSAATREKLDSILKMRDSYLEQEDKLSAFNTSYTRVKGPFDKYNAICDLAKKYGFESPVSESAGDAYDRIAKVTEVNEMYTSCDKLMRQIQSSYNDILVKDAEYNKYNKVQLEYYSKEIDKKYTSLVDEYDRLCADMKTAAAKAEDELLTCFKTMTGEFNGGKSENASNTNLIAAAKEVVSLYNSLNTLRTNLKTACDETLVGYKQQLDMRYRMLSNGEIIPSRWESQTTMYNDACAKIDKMNQYNSASEDKLSICKSLYDRANFIVSEFSNSSAMNNIGSQLCLNNTSQNKTLVEAQELLDKLKTGVAHEIIEVEKVKEFSKAFDNICDDLEGGHASLLKNFTFTIFEGEQDYEETYTTDVIAFYSDILDTAVEKARRAAVNTTSDADYKRLAFLYDLYKKPYDKLKPLVPASLQMWKSYSADFEQLSKIYQDASYYCDQKSYVGQVFTNNSIRLIRIVENEGKRLVADLNGYDEIYEQALDLELQVNNYTKQLAEQRTALTALEANSDAPDALMKVSDMIQFCSGYSIANQHLLLQNEEMPFLASKSELLDIYNSLNKHDQEPWIEVCAEEQIMQCKKVTEVISAAKTLKEDMTTFRNRCVKLLDKISGQDK